MGIRLGYEASSVALAAVGVLGALSLSACGSDTQRQRRRRRATVPPRRSA